MHNYLEKIIKEKQNKIMHLHDILKQPEHAISRIFLDQTDFIAKNKFSTALRLENKLAVIAEIKRRSPSKGSLAAIEQPNELAKKYVQGGATAISVLTDENFFGSQAADLPDVAQSVSAAILQKDFILEPIQIAEAKLLGADAILCIVALLAEKTKKLIDYAHKLGLEVLVEIHDEKELEIALNSGAKIIGVNNRNLNTFEVNTDTAIKLIEHIPNTIIKVAESGIMEPKIAQHYYQVGFNAVLIGEALVKSNNPQNFIKECQHV